MKAYTVSPIKYGDPFLLIARMEDGSSIGDSSQEVHPGDVIFGLTYDEMFSSLEQYGFISF